MTYEPEHLKLWTMPDSYFGPEHPSSYVFLRHNRDSDDLTESNFMCGLKAIGGESPTVQIVRETHWAVGWVEWIAISSSDNKSLQLADGVLSELDDYIVLDESDFSDREDEHAQDIWTNCFRVKDRINYIRRNPRQFEFDSFKDMIAQVRGLYFRGYASELIS